MLKQNVVAVIAEPSPRAILDTAREVMKEGRADISEIEIRLP